MAPGPHETPCFVLFLVVLRLVCFGFLFGFPVFSVVADRRGWRFLAGLEEVGALVPHFEDMRLRFRYFVVAELAVVFGVHRRINGGELGVEHNEDVDFFIVETGVIGLLFCQ